MCEHGRGAVLLVRPARARDLPARRALLRSALEETYTDAFFYFFFQEVTLQSAVLLGAVLFIFCGVSATGCLLLLPAAALVVLLAVRLHAASVLHNTTVKLGREMMGWVVELRGPLQLSPAGALRVVDEQDLSEEELVQTRHTQVVGTVSVWRHARDPARGWLGALAVEGRVRRRGAGGALLAAARGARVAGGRAGLLAAVSQLQPAARALLHKHGWECRGTYHRQLLGDVLTLPMAQLELDLPHA